MLRRLFLHGLLLPSVLLAGCTWSQDVFRETFKPDRIDYKSAAAQGKSDSQPLELPPQLSTPKVDPRFDINAGVKPAAASSGAAVVNPAPAAVPSPPIAANVRVERSGSERWLVVAGKPEQYWDTIKQFWEDTGFVIVTERPELGVMETDWAEHKAKTSGIWGSFLGMLTTTDQRDKFRTRLETDADGQTEIYITHRGMEETYRNEVERDQTIWAPRPADPALEAEFLRRLMVRLGSSEKAAEQSLAAADRNAPKKSKIVRDAGGSVVELDEDFDRAWRRVGLALDRVGFTVEDRDRAKGLYYVRYAAADTATEKKKSAGMFSGIKNLFKQDQAAADGRYEIQVSGTAPATRVLVLSKAGAPDHSQNSQRILSLLNEQLE